MNGELFWPTIVGVMAAAGGGVGFLAISANAAQLALPVLALGRYLWRNLIPTKKNQLENISPKVSLIYSKISRRSTLFAIISFSAAAGIAIDIPGISGEESIIDPTAGAILPLFALLRLLIKKRFFRFLKIGYLVNKNELRLLIAYENLVDDYLKQILNSKKVIDFVKDNYYGKYPEKWLIEKKKRKKRKKSRASK